MSFGKKNDSENGQFSILHFAIMVLIGAIATFFPLIVTILWVTLIVISVNGLITKRKYLIWYAIAMSPGMEVWGRMSKAPIVPWEVGKYFLFLSIVLLLFGNLKKRPLYHTGGIILLLLIPSTIIALILLPFNYENWVMHAVGIIQIGILLFFTAKERWTKEEFFQVLKISVLPVIPILIYITLKTPDFKDVNFELGANDQTTAGFGSNQVSTIFGASLAALGILIALNRPLFKPFIINYFILCYIFFRGLITFSRGGMIAAVISLFIFFAIYLWGNRRKFSKFIAYFVIFSIMGVGVAYIADTITGNKLLLRYEGDTGSTLAGDKKKTLNTMTSDRYNLAETDILIFSDHLLFGVGPGESGHYREQYGGENIIAHTEYTRLLSESGFGGLCVIIVLTFFPFFWIRRIRTREGKAIAAALFTVAILNTFHAAMRTNATVVFYVLGAMPVFYSYKKVKPIPAINSSLKETIEG